MIGHLGRPYSTHTSPMPVLTGSVHANIPKKPCRAVFAVIRLELIEPGAATCVSNEARPRDRSDRGSFFLQAKKPLHSGLYEKIKTYFCTRDVCVIQHRTWPLRSTILNAHGTKASPDGLCTHTYIDKAFSCWFCCNSLRVARARRRNVCLSSEGMLSTLPILSLIHI